jgi:Carboxypeptidase regulatory-like domain
VRSLGLALLLLVLCGCGSVHRAAPPPTPAPSGSPGTASVSGHVAWPDCRVPSRSCRSLEGVPIHFADASANRVFTAISDAAGAYTIAVPPGSYVVIAGNADRSAYQRPLTVRQGDAVTLDLLISPPTG